jgi:adenylosuccinate synthase
MKIQVISGGQFGSEGKGAVAAHLARDESFLVAVRVAGPNAGHTVIDDMGNPWPLRQIPVAAVVNPDARLYIAPGSEIDPDVLMDEVARLDNAGFNVGNRLIISPQATVITREHKQIEADRKMHENLGSTAKGIGAARAARIMRDALTWGEMNLADEFMQMDPYSAYRGANTVQIEGTQGYGLGLHAGFYPYCTSSDARAIDFMAMAGVTDPWNHEVESWLAVRPNPIRVAGNSGPLLDETSWDELGLPVERTTVTKKVRRVGGWDADLVQKAIWENGGVDGVEIALTMADHVWQEIAGWGGMFTRADLPQGLVQFIDQVQELGAPVRLLGTGPNTMIEVA